MMLKIINETNDRTITIIIPIAVAYKRLYQDKLGNADFSLLRIAPIIKMSIAK